MAGLIATRNFQNPDNATRHALNKMKMSSIVSPLPQIPAPTTPVAIVDGSPPESVAIHFDGHAITYGALAEESRALAAGLDEVGIGEGDRVGLWLPNTPAYLTLFLACCRLGAIAVAVNTRYRAAEVADIVGRSGCKVLVMQPGFRGIDFAGVLADIDPTSLKRLETVVLCEAKAGEAEAGKPMLGKPTVAFDALKAAPPTRIDRSHPDLPAKIFTTSGTTKAPKFVLHAQGPLARHGQDVARAFGFDAPDAVTLQVNPLCGVFGFSQVMGALASGRPCVLEPTFDAGRSARLIRGLGVTATCGSDEMFARLFDAMPGAERPFPTLRLGVYATFNTALEDIIERGESLGVFMMGVYGMSEVGALFSRWPEGSAIPTRRRGGGVPVAPESMVRTRDRETGEILPDGIAGELEIKAPSMLLRYFENPEATAEAFTEDGFLRTGDLAQTEEGGAFVYLARMGDTLRLGGFLTSPAEIEGELMRQPGIEAVQVVGAAIDGQPAAIAFAIASEGHDIDTAATLAALKRRLAGYKAPKRLYVLDAFPTTESANGVKVQKKRLREMAEDRLSAEARSQHDTASQ